MCVCLCVSYFANSASLGEHNVLTIPKVWRRLGQKRMCVFLCVSCFVDFASLGAHIDLAGTNVQC